MSQENDMQTTDLSKIAYIIAVSSFSKGSEEDLNQVTKY